MLPIKGAIRRSSFCPMASSLRIVLFVACPLLLRAFVVTRHQVGSSLLALRAKGNRARFEDGMRWEDSTLRDAWASRPPSEDPQNLPVAPEELEEAASREHFFSVKSFAELGASAEIISALRTLGVETPSRIQSLSFAALLEGSNAVVAEQTGSGKTLAYLAPLVQRCLEAKRKDPSKGAPRLLILAPTAELAEQVHSVCRGLCEVVKADVTLSSLLVTSSSGSLGSIASVLRKRSTDIVVATPGRAVALLKAQGGRPPALDLSRDPCIVLDEVDVLFLDDSFGLQPIGAAASAQAQFVFVTATLPQEVLKTLTTEFPAIQVLCGPGLHRAAPGVRKVLLDCSLDGRGRASDKGTVETALQKKLDTLVSVLEARPLRRTIVFCNSVDGCRRVENALNREDRREMKWKALPYHSAVSSDAAQRSLSTFSALNSLVPLVLVCTDRASRGMDFGFSAGRATGRPSDSIETAGVDHVILFDFPRDVAEWVRRVGRTGRAGRKGLVTILAQGKQVPLARDLIVKTSKGERLYDLPGGDSSSRKTQRPRGSASKGRNSNRGSASRRRVKRTRRK